MHEAHLPDQPSPKKPRRFLHIFLTLLLLGLTSFALLVSLMYWYAVGQGPLGETKTVILEQGSSSNTITAKLEQEGVIRFAPAFQVMQIITDTRTRLRAGEYNFQAGISAYEVLQKLAKGDTVIRKITVPEGYTSKQILKKINEDTALSGEPLKEAEEGSIYPDTYYYTYNEPRVTVLKRMQARMNEVMDTLWKQFENRPVATKKEWITFASIVEKETGKPEERGLVASVFYNRLKKGMRLQTDPTVIYAITQGEELGRPLLTKDLSYDSPYNTYLYAGLPPAAICNPGKESLLAVLNPATSDYLYFVADGKTGGHLFGRTLQEHNDNVAKFRKALKAAQ